MPNPFGPYHPIIYVRGFAGTQGEIEDTVGDPYMGFNLGSTKARQVWNGSMRRYYFESPLVRLKDEPIWLADPAKGLYLSEARYDDVYVNGEDLTAPHPSDSTKPLRQDITLPYQSIVILRYYDVASDDFGDGKTHAIEEFAKQLNDLILRLRAQVCRRGGAHPLRIGETIDNGVSEDEFRVYLVSHSMGGLVCRAFLQNPALGKPDARRAVDKFFTYATPHNGIDLRVVRNVPGWSSLGDATNFNRERMKQYFALDRDAESVSEVKNFAPDRIFNLIGTNPADYLVMKGLSSWAVGESSDGLVRMDNATTFGMVGEKRIESPRAYVHRSHSGQYGIVNSEEGFQNLTRFLFGSVRADGFLDVLNVTLPDEVQAAYNRNPDSVRASYRIEIVSSLRGSQWQLHRRVVRENSAIQRTYDQLFPKNIHGVRAWTQDNSPHLFSLFLDPLKSQRRDGSVSFAFDVAVLVPDYEIDGVLWLKRHFEGGYLVRKLVVVEAKVDPAAPVGWTIMYGMQSETPNDASTPANLQIVDGTIQFEIDINSPSTVNPSIVSKLRIIIRNWQ
ncbi:PGAP1-like protein [Paraburkholderia caribensis]|uniref:esterase/lipase family protein n=1 Tax=Paraburkholderia caribensis TaxID=75105 RepID=UPI001CAB47FF|nr:hypothetical protein [Paraburkholderia caribensis]CAG9209272.1 PGAP1-like protein [Paraburkholderia caribensis]